MNELPGPFHAFLWIPLLFLLRAKDSLAEYASINNTMLIRFCESKKKRSAKTMEGDSRAINIYFDRYNNLKRYTNFRLPAMIRDPPAGAEFLFAFFFFSLSRCHLLNGAWIANDARSLWPWRFWFSAQWIQSRDLESDQMRHDRLRKSLLVPLHLDQQIAPTRPTRLVLITRDKLWTLIKSLLQVNP